MSAAQQRKDVIRARLARQGEVTFSELALELQVSEMTIRRDIELLEAEGTVRKIMGGAIFAGTASEPSFAARAAMAGPNKIRIAQAVVANLSHGETVILDSGSTALAVAREIKGLDLGLRIVTSNLLVGIELADDPGTEVMVTGGLVRPGELSLVGTDAVDAVAECNVDTFVMGVAGIDAERGFTDYHREEGHVKRAAIRAARRVIVTADMTKMGHVHLVNVAPLSAASMLITDATIGDPAVAAARSTGVEVVSVEHTPDDAPPSLKPGEA